MRTNKAILRISLICLIVLQYVSVNAQSSVDKPIQENYVTWVRSIDSNQSENRSFFEKLINTIFGKRNYVKLSMPISVIEMPDGNLKILDQQNNTIWTYDQKKNRLEMLVNSSSLYPSLVGVCVLNNSEFVFTDSFLNEVFI